MARAADFRSILSTHTSRCAAYAGANRFLGALLHKIPYLALIALLGCAGTTSQGGGPSVVTVNVQPLRATLFLGQTQQFQATVTGTSDTSVTWTVNGLAGGSASAGTISTTGLYTAPGILPSPAVITITATNISHPDAAASAPVTLTDDIMVGIVPPSANVSTEAGQAFTASITATGAPSTAVTWSVNGIAGGNSSVGIITASGNNSALYVAPAVPPSPSTVSVTATSVADPAKSASASVSVMCSASNSVSPPSATVLLAQTQAFSVSFCLAADTTVTWDVNGIAGGNATFGTISSTGASAALYTAPTDLPSPNTLQIHAVSGVLTASASVTLASNIGVSVSPSSATVAVGQRKSFSATVANTSDPAVSWLVSGVANGNATLGQVCQAGSIPCVAPAGPGAAIDFLAPGAVPPSNLVTLTAVSHADPSKTGNAFVTITSVATPTSVAVAPLYAFVPPSTGTLSTIQFFATVLGASNTSVTWTAQSAVPGQGCSGAACGSVDGNGLFTAPQAAPSPNAISIIATSVADATKSASATIAVTSGPTIEILLPSSVTAGAVEGFPLVVQGLNFLPGSNGAGSSILINGTARGTSCQSSTTCATALNPADIQSAATLSVQVSNPTAPARLSNPVPFVIVPFSAMGDIITLSPAQPAATNKDVVVAEATTAAVSAPLDVDFDGPLTAGTCLVEGTPLILTRPVSASQTFSICIHGNGLDPTMTYVFTGPGATPGDIPVVASAINGLFPDTIELDLQISSTTAPGVRTLFVTSLNNDRAAATGILEVQ